MIKLDGKQMNKRLQELLEKTLQETKKMQGE